MDKFVQTVLEYAKNIANEKLCGKNDCISMRARNGYMYITKPGTDFNEITENDIERVELVNAPNDEYALHAQIYDTKLEVNAICHVHPKWVVPVAETGVAIPAVLDDMAQLVGPTCKTAQNNIPSILKNLKGRNSCLIKGDGCITTGRSMDEAYTCVMVLDKASHCFVSSAVIGKNKVINIFEAVLMRIVYKKKYSKINQANLLAKEEGEE